MKDLISRLEAASEGSRELDARIAESLGWKVHWATDVVGDFYPYGVWGDEKKGEKGIVPRFSSSLDAALTLVPEGCGFVVSDADWKTARASVAWKNTPADFDAPYRDVRAATPALALCIASLRAREQDDG